MAKKLTCVIVGAGHRSLLYASYALEHPEELAVVGVADPSAQRRKAAADMFGFPEERCYESAQALADAGRIADFVINGTMDHQHVETSIPLLEAGYDMLLEKPFATNAKEMWELVRCARRHGRTVAICHVLRHAPFYRAIREKIATGIIGEILNVQATEHVSYHHMSVGYIRGKWANTARSHSTMLMAKSCHDLDLIAWMKSGTPPVRVSSFGNNFQFRPERAPENAGTRCLVDCPIEADCLYSARKHFIDHPDRWAFYVWDSLEHLEEPTMADKLESLKTSPYGQCVWKTDMDVVDHQSVAIEFADGATATLNMIGGAAKPSRSLHLVGTEGEIQGNMEESAFVVRSIDPSPGHEYQEEVIDLKVGGDMTGTHGGHGGGDLRLVADFLGVLGGGDVSVSTTVLDDSVAGHMIGFCADISAKENRVVDIKLDR